MKYEVLSPYLAFGTHNPRKDYTLKRGDVVELPETEVATRAMLARGQIREAAAAQPETAQKTKNNAGNGTKTVKK